MGSPSDSLHEVHQHVVTIHIHCLLLVGWQATQKCDVKVVLHSYYGH